MIQTLSQMRSDLSSWVPGFTPDNYDAAINRAYHELSKIYPWSVFDTEFNFVTKQHIATGGVKFNNGTTSITAATSVSAAWGSTADAFQGMFIKKEDEGSYYTICASTSVQITISSNYLGKTTTAVASAGDGYVIFQHIYAIPSGVETVTHLMHNSYLEEMDNVTFEQIDPDLDSEGEPSKWRNAGKNSSNVTLVQLFPARLDDVYEIRGRGRLRPEILTSTTSPLLDSILILNFASIELMQRKRMINPATVSDDMLKNALDYASRSLESAMALDWRKSTVCKYTHDNFFKSYHRGQKWYTSHDPWDA